MGYVNFSIACNRFSVRKMPQFSKYQVIEKIAECDLISSFVLAPTDGLEVPSFVAGQHLTVRIPEGLSRSYTISSSPSDRSKYRLTIKHEKGRDAEMPAGKVSTFMHDRVSVGSVLDIAGPYGAFHLDPTSDRPVVLLSGGVGITPMISMLHVLADTTRQVSFVHACDNGTLHAFHDEVGRLATTRPGISCYFIYRNPTAADLEDQRHHSSGLVTANQLRAFSAQDSDFYLCGPSGFMQMVHDGLTDAGVSHDRIRYESFGPATVLSPRSQAVQSKVTEALVVFEGSGLEVEWDDFSGSLLDFAEMNGVYAESACRSGSCNTCECSLLEGQVDYLIEPAAPLPAGRCLPCVAKPASVKVRLDI
ncbi:MULTISPECIES: FAD-binding oxidoreductase [Paraburkholderia]|uniref:2Fe-2S iron-sulfur cluster binding domain-containing protein n=1 Tax=Paraburkholderia podalyriae TaxID=1938811 RepID=A0ABR7PZG1_9BURK|nr:FAD-binding oxidoreductase [Paraburkholderia podalyriae]MBC8751675.1 2Fe-2S iron-sulfur cluster binding domain-containing protein [Paraburkholderia podalyriae]